MSAGKDAPPKVLGREQARPLPARFYATATAGPASAQDGFSVLLDGRPARTPKGRALLMATQALADAVAQEWDAQRPAIDPATMPLTRLVNTVIDGVRGRENEIREDIIKYAGSDLICYRAEGPDELIARQARTWDPVLAWAASSLGIRLAVAEGVMPVSQGRDAREQTQAALAGLDAYRLAALHVMVTLTGSAVLALAVLHGHLMPEAAWSAAHIDEDWQIAQWGEDAEAAARRRRRWADMRAAADLLRLLA